MDTTTYDEEISKATSETSAKANGFGVRHFQIFLLFTLLAASYGMRVNMSVGIVAMVDKLAHPTAPVYPWDEQKQGLILSAFFWGYLISQVPVSELAHRFGPKIMLMIASLSCGILTIATPWAATLDWKALIFLRALQGLFQGFVYPCVHMMLGKWAHPSELGKLTTFAYSGTQAGTVITLGVSGILASSFMGWPSIFYLTGCATLIWSGFWYFYGSNSPSESVIISKEEKSFIESGSGSSNRGSKVPWSKILTSAPVWALVVVHSTQCWGFWTLLTETPSFLKQIFHFEIKTNALLSALPYLAMWALSIAVSPICDYLINKQYMTVQFGRKFFNSLGHWFPMVLFIALPYATGPALAVSILTVAVGVNSFTYVGYMCNHMDLSPRFSGSLMGLTNSIANIMSILGPITVGYILTGDGTTEVKREEWKTVFFIAAGFYLVGNLVFVIFGKAEIQAWNEVDEVVEAEKSPAQQIGSSAATVETVDE